ncbi:MAG: hypothetical protein ACE5KY_04895 [Candidatus Tectimicrobiota bacterium]
MVRRAWLRGLLLGVGLVGLLAACRAAPPPPAPVAEAPVPTGPLCKVQGRPAIEATGGAGWQFCVRQEADCNLANAAEAVRLRWCAQSSAQTCLDTGCQKYRAKACRFGVTVPAGTQLEATPPRNTLCGARWACTVRAPGPAAFACTCECPPCQGAGEAPPPRAPLVPLAEGTYAVVVVWADESFCPNGQMRVSAFEGDAFTLTAVGKCLPKELTLRAVFAPAGGAFFAVGDDPAGPGVFHLTGVVEDPDAFTGLLTRSSGPDERVEERLRLTGRRMTTTQ